MTKRYILSWAQNATPVFVPLFESFQTFCRHNDAELIVIPGRYRNPTSLWSRGQQDGEWWAPELEPYLAGSWSTETKRVRGKDTKRRVLRPARRKLGKLLEVYTDISIQPTASRPLSGFEVFTGNCHAIFGHPKRALEVVPTGTRSPRVQFTTSACTVRNYTPTKAGKKGDAHHVLGALVVEVEPNGTFFARHITSNQDGSFTDLATTYRPEGAFEAERAETLTLGDLHAVRAHEPTLAAAERLAKIVRPRYTVIHDALDFEARNHHDRGLRSKFDKRFSTVEAEVGHTCGTLDRVSRWVEDGQTVVVRSNHDEFFERWLNEHNDTTDAVNAPYYHQMWSRAFSKRKDGRWPNLLELEARRLGLRSRKVRFLARNESFRRGGVEHGFHGDKGPNGSRGTKLAFARLGCKVNIGHSHVAGIMDSVWQAGHVSDEDHGYNDLPSGWVRTAIVTHADRKRQMIFFVKGKFCGGDSCS